MSWITVTPAYGRDYKNQKAARADWDADKDFIETHTGKYINKSQAKEARVQTIIRYSNQRRTMQT